MKNNIDEYFAKQGINLLYNTLGHTDELVSAYIKDSYYMFKISGAHQSNAIKSSIYNKFYSFKPRDKKTGFEKLASFDNNFRNYKVPTSLRDAFLYPNKNFSVNLGNYDNYFDLLKASVSKIYKPLVFYSGGIDSELVLQAFISVGITPDIVVFEFLDKFNNPLNDYDLQHAYEFCSKNNIKPIIKQIIPELLWEQTDFIQLGRELRIGSPQILTHLYMAKIMSIELPNHTYCFGGEIRYSDYDKYSVGKTVLVNSVKTDPQMASLYETTFDYTQANSTLAHETFRPGYYVYPSPPYPGDNSTAWEVYALNTSTFTATGNGGLFYGTYSTDTITSGGGGTFTFKFTWTVQVNTSGQPDSSILVGDAIGAGQNNFYTPTGSNNGTSTINIGGFWQVPSAPAQEFTVLFNWYVQKSAVTVGPWTSTLSMITV